jgi:hypothetical protein
MRRSAPPVSVELAPDPLWRHVALLVPSLAAVTVLTWLIAHALTSSAASRDRQAASLLSYGVAAGSLGLCAWAAWRLRRMADQAGGRLVHPAGQRAPRLSWDGRAWFVQHDDGSDPIAVALQLRLDVGRWLLLSCQPVDAPAGTASRSTPVWISLARHRHATAWHLLRCALYSPRPQHPPRHDR